MFDLRPILLLILLPMTVAGCATVDPQLDYVRASEYIRQSTGQASVQPSEDNAVVEQRVSELLAEGITLDEAVQICLINNPEFQAAWHDVGMARADFVQSSLLSNPSLGVILRFPAGGGLANLRVGLAQNIAELWQIPYRKRAAQRSLDQAILLLARKATDLLAETRVAYFNAAGASQLQTIQQENLTIANELLEMALARQEAGAATELEVNLSRSISLEAELAVESSRLVRSEALRALATLLGLEIEANELHLLDSLVEVPCENLDLPVLIALAKSSRLDVQAARQEVEASAARLQEQYRRVFPGVKIGVVLERGEGQSQGGRDILADTARASIANGALTAPGIQPRSERRRNTDLIIGPSLDLELPIFDQNQAQIAKAIYAHEQAGKVLEALERSVTQEVRGAVDRTATALRVLKIYRERSVPLAQNNLDLSREAFRAGRASFLSVLEAQRIFLDSRSQYVEAAQTVATAIPELERTVGVPFETIVNGTKSISEETK